MSVSRKRLVLVLKSVFAVAVIVAIGWHFYSLLSANPLRDRTLTIRLKFLLPAGVLYLAAHTLWGTFFWQLLRNQGGKISWFTGVRAYFVSQFGKYVPGKAWVILLRVVMLKSHGLSPAVVGVTGTYETLTSMAAGAMIGVWLLPWSGFTIEVGSGAWFGFMGVALLPLVLGVLNRLVSRVVKRYRGAGATPLPSPSVLLLFQGLVQASAGWCLLGGSLWLTIQGLTDEPIPFTVDLYLGLIGATTLSYVAGFAALILPGGLGARELLLQRMLTFQLAPIASGPEAFAVIVSLVLRLVWTVFEVTFALLLWWTGRRGVKHGVKHGG